VAGQLGLHLAKPGIIMEGGSVDFNGNGVVISSKACLLNPNRNPDLKQAHIEQKLRDYYGIDHILWIEDGIEGDDTDGHIDDTVRFVNESTVITMVEKNHDDFNREPLLVNRKLLEEMTINESRLAVVDIQMPEPLYFDGKRLPASYANFYISNEHVIVPVFNSKNDDQALTIIQDCFPRRKVVGIDSTHLVWGLGSFHCLSQQEPV
jgi:agmatine deiminase